MNKEAKSYLDRNQKAIQAAIALFDDPDYLEIIEQIRSTSDPAAKQLLETNAKSYAGENVDLEALHRHINAMNRRNVEEGLLPPETSK